MTHSYNLRSRKPKVETETKPKSIRFIFTFKGVNDSKTESDKKVTTLSEYLELPNYVVEYERSILKYKSTRMKPLEIIEIIKSVNTPLEDGDESENFNRYADKLSILIDFLKKDDLAKLIVFIALMYISIESVQGKRFLRERRAFSNCIIRNLIRHSRELVYTNGLPRRKYLRERIMNWIIDVVEMCGYDKE